jgi:hypothetical protein
MHMPQKCKTINAWWLASRQLGQTHGTNPDKWFVSGTLFGVGVRRACVRVSRRT